MSQFSKGISFLSLKDARTLLKSGHPMEDVMRLTGTDDKTIKTKTFNFKLLQSKEGEGYVLNQEGNKATWPSFMIHYKDLCILRQEFKCEVG